MNLNDAIMLGPNSKSLQGFQPWTPLRGLRELAGWIAKFAFHPHLIFKIWHLLGWWVLASGSGSAIPTQVYFHTIKWVWVPKR